MVTAMKSVAMSCDFVALADRCWEFSDSMEVKSDRQAEIDRPAIDSVTSRDLLATEASYGPLPG
jgi:hypothetical protein